MKIKTLMTMIVVIFAIISTSGCEKNREYNEAEVLEAAKTAIKNTEILNEIYYGQGIPYDKNESLAEGSYYPASSLYLSRIGISTIDELKKLTSSTYTSELSQSIFDTKLSSISNEDGIQAFTRYYQKYDPDDKKTICIMVYKDAIVFLTDKVAYDYDSMVVTGSVGEKVYVKLSAVVTNRDGESQTQELKVALIEQSDGWRIDSPTYLSYEYKSYNK